MEWAETQGIALCHIQPGKPQQNAYVERYNRTVRHEWLDPIHHRKHRGGTAIRHAMALDLQQRTAQYGHRRHHTRTETENGRVNSTAEPR